MYTELISAGNWANSDENMFIGTEVEGRYKGLRTLFVTGNKISAKTLLQEIKLKRIQHVWFDLHHKNWQAIEELLWDTEFTAIVTVEVTLNTKTVQDIPMSIFPKVHVVTTILVPDIINMKGTDSINIVSGRGHVYAGIKECLQETKPEDYANDTTA